MVTETTIEEARVKPEPATSEARRAYFTAAGLVRGVDVEVRNAAVGAVLAADDVRLQNFGARTIFAGGALEMHRGGAGLIVAGGDSHLRQGGAQAVISAGSITMEQAGTGFAIARKVRIGRGGMAIFAVTPRMELDPEARVMFGPAVSTALLGGLLAMIVFAAGRLRRRVRTAR